MMIEHYLALDFETSGLEAFDRQGYGRHVAVEIGVVEMRGGEPGREFNTLIGPAYDVRGQLIGVYEDKALAISGRTFEDLAGKPHPREVVESLTYIPGWTHLPVVAYNSRFDFTFWRRTLQIAQRRTPWAGRWHCAMLKAKGELKLDRYKLADVAQHLGVGEQAEVHGALPDAMLAGRVFWALQLMRQQGGSA